LWIDFIGKNHKRRKLMSIETFLLFVLVIFLVVSLPAWPYSKEWGYRPTGIFTVLLVVFLIWAIAGGRPLFGNSVGHDMRVAGHDMVSAGHDAANSVRNAVR
jgi:hypothetical protein